MPIRQSHPKTSQALTTSSSLAKEGLPTDVATMSQCAQLLGQLLGLNLCPRSLGKGTRHFPRQGKHQPDHFTSTRVCASQSRYHLLASLQAKQMQVGNTGRNKEYYDGEQRKRERTEVHPYRNRSAVLSVFGRVVQTVFGKLRLLQIWEILQSDNNTGKSLMHSDIYLTCTPCPGSFETKNRKA